MNEHIYLHFSSINNISEKQFLMLSDFPYPKLNFQQLKSEINRLSVLQSPFLFIINFRAIEGYIITEKELNPIYVRFKIDKHQNYYEEKSPIRQLEWETFPVSFDEYLKKFEYVQEQIRCGNSYLVNLTQPTKLKTNLSLSEIYEYGTAKYKLWLKDKFTVLSPESFIQIRNGKISSFPMKGTIDASIPCAAEIILNDPKEKAEHATIVDLIRNDLSIVAENVKVSHYRYIEKISTNKGDLLQVSSEITADLPENKTSKLGDIILSLIPAGSISGAPKPKTLRIIENAEMYDRGFYTGIFGYFDGKDLDSAVMIRFIEQQNNQLIFKSGGGITSQSEIDKEYKELIQKVYVPVH